MEIFHDFCHQAQKYDDSTLHRFSCNNIHTAEPVLTDNVREWGILASKHSSSRRQHGGPMGPLGMLTLK